MDDYFWVMPTVLAAAAVGYSIYAVSTRGFKGAMFGHRIAETQERTIEYRHKGAKHTIRIHRLSDDDLFGLEVGIWTGVFGETIPVVVPRKQLLELRDLLSECVDPARESGSTL